MRSESGGAADIERLHALTSRNDADLGALFDGDLKEWTVEFISSELPGLGVPPLESPQAFVEVLRELRDSKQRWSNALASLVLEAADGDDGLASERLKEFIEQCPWRFLKESAARKLHQ